MGISMSVSETFPTKKTTAARRIRLSGRLSPRKAALTLNIYAGFRPLRVADGKARQAQEKRVCSIKRPRDVIAVLEESSSAQ